MGGHFSDLTMEVLQNICNAPFRLPFVIDAVSYHNIDDVIQ